MRQILFKAKRLDNNEWITGDLLQEVDGAMYIHTQGINTNPLYYHKVDPSTVCQFTGLKDKNGEGDLGRRYTKQLSILGR